MGRSLILKNLLAIAIFTLSAFAQDHPARTSAGCGPSGVQYDVKSDKSANHGQSYLLVPVDPGEHHLCVDWQSSVEERSKQGAAVTLTAEAGKVYYFRATVEQREKHSPAIVLEALDPAQGQFLISTSSLSKSHAKN